MPVITSASVSATRAQADSGRALHSTCAWRLVALRTAVTPRLKHGLVARVKLATPAAVSVPRDTITPVTHATLS